MASSTASYLPEQSTRDCLRLNAAKSQMQQMIREGQPCAKRATRPLRHIDRASPMTPIWPI